MATLSYLDLVFGKKLEGWAHPEIVGSVEPTALSAARRNPKLFWGVSLLFTGPYVVYFQRAVGCCVFRSHTQICEPNQIIRIIRETQRFLFQLLY